MPLTVEIWSDVVCPWCYIGKRRFEAALERFEHRDEVTVMWRSFELDPEAARDVRRHRRRTAGRQVRDEPRSARCSCTPRWTERAAGEGLEYHLDQPAAATRSTRTG